LSDIEDDLFEGKRSWSIIKDQVLKTYMSPYLAKVKNLKKPIVLFDGYAGPGVFEDREPGSPLIMCQAAEKATPGNYQAFFVNKKKKYHDKLESILQKGGWHGPAQPILGDTTKILPTLPAQLTDHTAFLYLDPFGPTGSPFSLIEPFLTRNVNYSTEMVIMMHMPVLHRLASRRAVEAGRENEDMIRKRHERVNATLGGTYWQSIMWDTSPMSTQERENRLINAYVAKLNSYLPYAGCCPVREGPNKVTKYFIVFVSRHPDAMLLMNDAMYKAYHSRMHDDTYAGTMFEQNNWNDGVSKKGLDEAVVEEVDKTPGLRREDVWTQVVRNNFMKYWSSDYKNAVNRLVECDVLYTTTPHKTKRLNDDCVLFKR
jgi:three-Cys-motif partner protein